jgi:hypothetical protein
VPSLPVMKDLQVLKDRVGELEAGAPSLAIEEFGLHAGPEGLDDSVVVGVPAGVIDGSRPESCCGSACLILAAHGARAAA